MSCLNCEKRHVGCHSSCEEYAEFKRNFVEQKEIKRKQKERQNIVVNYIFESREKQRRRNGATANGMNRKTLLLKSAGTVSLARGRDKVEKKQKENKGLLRQKADAMLEVQESVGRLFLVGIGRRYKGNFVPAC